MGWLPVLCTGFMTKKQRKKGSQQGHQQQQQQPQQRQPVAVQLQQELQQHWQDAAAVVVHVLGKEQTQQHQQVQKQQRSSTVILYHQTSPDIARAILSTGQMKPGAKGYGGAGIYFAAAPEVTTTKATKKGVILECEVDLGKVKEISCSGDWSNRLWHWLYDYDSIKITSISDGTEWVVFDSIRVKAVRLWQPGVSTEQLALLLLLAGNAAAVLQCALLAVAQVLQQMQHDGLGLPGCGRPSLRSLGKC